MPIPDLIATITDNCESLNSKPKLFFIQACQGMNVPQRFGERVYRKCYLCDGILFKVA